MVQRALKAGSSSDIVASSGSFKGQPDSSDDMLEDVSSSDPEVIQVQEILKLLKTDPDSIDKLISDLGIEFFRMDSHWRDTFLGLMALPSEENHLKILALKEYLEYLKTTPATIVPTPNPYADTDASSPDPWGIKGHMVSNNPATQSDSALKVPDSKFIRLPHNEPVLVKPEHNQFLDIWLSHHHFHFHSDKVVVFIDSNGRNYLLHEGRNFLGRATYNDVVLDPEYTDVSRRHLILDICNGRLASITDLSSRGTYVRADSCWEHA